MAASLLALLDDIAFLADDVATMSKIAAKKTAGVVGDDIALNANQVTGMSASRELPVILKVAKGSAINKLILVPAALAIAAFAPWLLTPLLMIGGTFLCFEGVEKIAHHFHKRRNRDAEAHEKLAHRAAMTPEQIVAAEKEKIKGAIRTDFILSAEIIAITLSTVQDVPFSQQALVVSVLAAIFTVGVYAVVAAVVKMDDLGLYLLERPSQTMRALGKLVLAATPYIMKIITIVGTLAMFLVGGGLIVHGLPFLQAPMTALEHGMAFVPGVGAFFSSLTAQLVHLVVGLLFGGVTLAVVTLIQKLRNKPVSN